jgi:hypothetical protein
LRLPGADRLRALPEVWLLWAVWSLVGLSQLALSVGEVKGYTPITGGAEKVAAWVAPFTDVCDALVLVACAAALVLGLRADPSSLRSPRRLGLLVVLLAPWVVLVAHSLATGGPVGPGVLPYPALAIAFWALRPRLAAVEAIGHQVVAAAVVSMALAVAVPSAGLYVGGAGFESEKLVSGLGILAGFLPTGNTLGGYLAIGLPSVLTIRRGWVRWAGLAATVVALAWSSSRTAWAAAAVVVVGLVALRVARGRVRTVLAVAALGGLALVAVLLPFAVTGSKQFNHRGGYWMFLRGQWTQDPVLGHGLDYFERLAASPVNLGGYAYHAHNVAMQVLITGGLLLAVLVVLLLAVAGRRAVALTGQGVDWAVLVLASVALVATFEIPVSFADYVKVNLAAMLPLLVLVTAREPAGERAT